MNAEVIKAMNQVKKEHKFRKWWHKNGYKVWRVVLFPLWLGDMAYHKLHNNLMGSIAWSDDRTNEILNYYIPRHAEWNEKDKAFYFFDNGMGWNFELAKRHLKRKDYGYWKKYCGWWGGEIATYLKNSFELEGFEKELGNCSEGWTEVNFYLKEGEE